MTEKRERIFIGVPCYQNVAGQTLEDYMRFMYHCGRRLPEYDFFLGVKTKTEQFRARNAIVQAALDVGADWLLMIDDDHVININDDSGKPGEGSEAYDFLKRLLAHNVDIVGPTYYQRGGESKPVVMREDHGAYYFMDDNELTGGLQEVAVQGGGCMLIKMRIFDKIKQPWFEPEHTYGTDIQLCKQARAKGFKIYTDSGIELGHVWEKRVIISSKNKDQFRESADTREQVNMIAGWQANSVLHLYKYDAMKYLNIKDDKQMAQLFADYDDKANELASKWGRGTNRYYAKMGPEQLARQVLYHYSEKPRTFMSFILQTIRANMPGRALDFGCGSAPVGFDLAKRGHEFYFIDVDGACAYEFLKWRAKRYDIEDRCFFNKWPLDNSCDYALFLDILEHLEDWQTPVKQAIACLKDYGFFITNYVMISKDGNPEHINMDRGEFMKFMYNNGMHPLTSSMFQKKVLQW